jgi:hypothetical protein
MARAFQYGNYAVYVYDERGERHHRAHAHIKRGGQVIATVYLETLEVAYTAERLDRGLLAELRTNQETLIDLWMKLNESD